MSYRSRASYSNPMALAFRHVDLRDVDAADETFRVRLSHPDALHESIRRNGIRTPLIVERTGGAGAYRIVSGWGRWESRPEGVPLPCFVLPGGLTLEAVWDVLLKDNDSWNVMAIARVVRGLRAVPGLDPDRIVTEKLPLLGVHASHDLFRRHLRLLDLPQVAQRFIEEENLPLRRAMIFFKLAADALERFLGCARELRFTLGEVGEALEMLEEAAHREGTSALMVLQEILDGFKGASGAGKDAFRRALRERRYPELSRYRERLEALEKQLSFTVPVRIEWDARLERPGIRLAADLAGETALETFERELAANREVLRRFFEVL